MLRFFLIQRGVTNNNFIFDNAWTVHRDKSYNGTDEMHFLSSTSDSVLYMFRMDKLFVFIPSLQA